MRYAVIENGTVINVVVADSNEAQLHADWVASDTAFIGDQFVNGAFSPVRVIEPAPIARSWDAIMVRSKLTLAERVKWDNDKSDAIKTAKVEFSSPCDEAHTREVLQLLVDAGDISAATMQAVLA